MEGNGERTDLNEKCMCCSYHFQQSAVSKERRSYKYYLARLQSASILIGKTAEGSRLAAPKAKKPQVED